LDPNALVDFEKYLILTGFMAATEEQSGGALAYQWANMTETPFFTVS